MEVKTKNKFEQKVTYDPKLDNVQKQVKSSVKEHNFDKMINRLGEDKVKLLFNK